MYNIYMEQITNEFDDDLVYTLTDNNGSVVGETPLPITSNNKTYLKTDISVGAKSTKSYTLTIEFKYSSTENQSWMEGSEFRATIGIDTNQGDILVAATLLQGTIKKEATGEVITNGNLTFYSEKQKVPILFNGKFRVELEPEEQHSVYYMGNQDTSSMTKEQIKANALCWKENFLLSEVNNEILLTCKDGIDQVGIKEVTKTEVTKGNSSSDVSDTSNINQIFKLGDYVSMTPTLNNYEILGEETGCINGVTCGDITDGSPQEINPSELNMWRIISINDDGTYDAVSQYVSSTNVYFVGKTGYQNYIGTLNKIAAAYTNSKYVVSTRHMGYNAATQYITDTTKLDQTTAPWIASTSSSTTPANEQLGAGDTGFEYDNNLVTSVIGQAWTYKKGTTIATDYWLASRSYDYYGPTDWGFYARYSSTFGSAYSYSMYRKSQWGFYSYPVKNAIRPIITFKSNLTPSGGDGKSEDTAWVLN